ncbi:hypothetical protein B0O99DRAFT_667754 [Bisporella sp. PMI_857]|nr:hypothetical protein B0O99DRAFT_667754 [Bisporella sp. PMI_857]
MSQTPESTWACLPIVKFSHNSCPVGVRNFIWNHIGLRNDMDFVIQNAQVVDGLGNVATRVVLKVVAGADTLELQDLGELIKICRDNMQPSGAEHPVQVVTRSPFLAMRYPQATSSNASEYVRRIQVKFSDPSDFIKARDVLAELGLPITESTTNASANPPPSSSPAPTMASSTPSLSTMGRVSLPTRPSSVSSYLVNSPAKSVSTILPMSNMPPTSTLNTSGFRPTSAFSYLPKKTSSLYLSQMEKEQSSYSMPGINLPTILEQHGLTSAAKDQNQYQLETSLSGEHNPANPSVGLPHEDNMSASQRQYNVEGFLNKEQYRLADEVYNNIVNGRMPPKRTLPFPDPRKKTRSSSVADLPPLPKPTPVQRAESTIPKETKSCTISTTISQQPEKKRVAQRKSTAAKNARKDPSKKSAQSIQDEITTLESPPQQEEPSPLATKPLATAQLSSSTSGLQSKAAAPKKRAAPRPLSTAKRAKMVDQSTQTRTVSGGSSGSAEAPIPAKHLAEAVQVSPISPPNEFLDSLDAFITKHKSRSAPVELWDTPGYAEADEEQRHILLNNFICENLDNADFLKLCQDTEKAWRRIGLGM